MEWIRYIEPDDEPRHESAGASETKPGAWYACVVAMWLCLASAAWAAYQAAPEGMTAAAANRAYENAYRLQLRLPTLPDIPPRTSWNLLLLIAAGNSVFGAVVFGSLAAIVRRVDLIARKAAK